MERGRNFVYLGRVDRELEGHVHVLEHDQRREVGGYRCVGKERDQDEHDKNENDHFRRGHVGDLLRNRARVQDVGSFRVRVGGFRVS